MVAYRGAAAFAVFASALWAGIIAWQVASYALPIEGIWGIEALRNLAWILFLIRLLELQAHGEKARGRQLGVARIAAVAITLILVSPLENLPVWLGAADRIQRCPRPAGSWIC